MSLPAHPETMKMFCFLQGRAAVRPYGLFLPKPWNNAPLVHYFLSSILFIPATEFGQTIRVSPRISAITGVFIDTQFPKDISPAVIFTLNAE
jgi:hypothetical protein